MKPEQMWVVGYGVFDDRVSDELAAHYEASNGSYHRYYPDPDWDYVDEGVKALVNATLVELGVPLDAGPILIEFSW